MVRVALKLVENTLIFAFFDKGNILISQIYQLYLASAPTRCRTTTRMRRIKKKIKRREIENKDPVVVMKHSQQQRSNHHRRQHLDCKRGSLNVTPPRRKQSTSVVVARSKILRFHPRESPSSQNNAFSKAIVRYNQ
jgi:hypothetical protein